MVMARRASLFQREIRVSLSSAAAELLVEKAQVLSEGQVEDQRFYGSTMMSLDLRRLETDVSDQVSAETTTRFSSLAAADKRLQKQTRELAVAEAERLCREPIRDAQVDVNVRADGPHLYIDMDIEADLRARPKSKPSKALEMMTRGGRRGAMRTSRLKTPTRQPLRKANQR